MARIKIAYVGGGSSRAPGTMASFMHHGAEFDGSEFVLIDLDPEHLEITRRISEQMARAVGIDVTVTATTDLRAGLADVDAVLSSFRPGNFAARAMDERIPLEVRRDRPGDAGTWWADDVAALGPGHARDLREPRRRGPECADLQLHQPRQHRVAGRL